MASPFQQTRSALFDWAARHHPAELKAGVDLYLGSEKRTEDSAFAALAFALSTAPPEGPSLTERYAEAHSNLPRAHREALAVWAKGRYGLYEVTEVIEDRGLELMDVFNEEADIFVQEKAATHALEPGDWLAAFLVPVSGHLELEGTLEIVLPALRIHAVQAMIAALGAPAVADPKATRRAARSVVAAMRAASGAAAASELPSGEWVDTVHAALDGVTPRQALASGRRAEVRALLPGDPEQAAWILDELGL